MCWSMPCTQFTSACATQIVYPVSPPSRVPSQSEAWRRSNCLALPSIHQHGASIQQHGVLLGVTGSSDASGHVTPQGPVKSAVQPSRQGQNGGLSSQSPPLAIRQTPSPQSATSRHHPCHTSHRKRITATMPLRMWWQTGHAAGQSALDRTWTWSACSCMVSSSAWMSPLSCSARASVEVSKFSCDSLQWDRI